MEPTPTLTAKPTLEQVMNGLIAQVRRAKGALAIGTYLNYLEPEVWQVAPMFFGATLHAHLEIAQMYLAKLYDLPSHSKRPVTIRTLLKRAEHEPALFTKGSPEEVLAAAKECRRTMSGIKKTLQSIEKRRNEALAHLDETTVMNPGGLMQTAPLSLEDLKKAYEATEAILLKMDRFFTGMVGPIYYLDQDDYLAVIRIIKESLSKPQRA